MTEQIKFSLLRFVWATAYSTCKASVTTDTENQMMRYRPQIMLHTTAASSRDLLTKINMNYGFKYSVHIAY